MSLMRRALLAGSVNPWLREQASRRTFVRRSVTRFMPGEHLEDALRAASSLRDARIRAMLTRLGESVTSASQAEQVTCHYLGVLDRLTAQSVDVEVSVKPTQLGLDLDDGLCWSNFARLIDRAASARQMVWLDMESSAYVDRTIALFRQARARTRRVGIAIQAYLYRSRGDIEALLSLGAAVRLVKGAYLEGSGVAYPRKADVDHNFYSLAVRLLSEEARNAGGIVHIATHDTALVKRLLAHIHATRTPSSIYEFAMLYGIQVRQQRELARAGHRVRVLISYGDQWFAWYMRRLAERPANVWFVVRNLLS